MTTLQAIILGVIQGITEFLPVSSSGHLLLPELMWGWPEQGIVFDVAMHLATLLAIVVYFRKKIWQLCLAAISRNASHDRMLAWTIALSVIPVGIIGMLDVVTEWFRSTPLVIGLSFILWGIVLGIADWWAKTHAVRPVEQSIRQDVWYMSLAQVLALIPGTSRSGITMTAGLFAGLSKKAAAEISFFMAIPVIAAAGFKQLLDMDALVTVDWSLLSIGFMSAFVSALLSVWGLLKIIERMGYFPFVLYRVALGILIFILFI